MNPDNNAEQTRAELSAIVESSDDAIIGKDLNGIITSWNRGAELLYGYKPEEVLGKHISLIAPPGEADDIAEIMARLRRGERIDHYETVRVSKSGRLLNISLTISPIRNSKGELTGASAIGRDVTEVRRAEAALRLAERLAAVGRLAATITHEINNPLDSIGNVLHLLAERETSEENLDLIRLGQEELRRVGQIVRQTLAFNRSASFPSEFVVKDAMEDVLDMYHKKIKDAGIRVERRYEFEGKILAHSVEVRQVFANIIRNAVEAMDTKGRLRVVVRQSRSWREWNKKGVRVLIFDEGCGIPKGATDQLFNPFFSTKQEQGTGLGLWVSKQIVTRQGGTIRFRSVEGKGTCFSVFLPLRPPERELRKSYNRDEPAPVSRPISLRA
jgi:two-component system CheB/CheR fusion protein